MNDLVSDIVELKKKTDTIYIYGTGMYGRNIYNMLMEHEIKVDGFVETNPEKSEVFGLPVYAARDILKDNIGLILGLNKLNTGYVENDLIRNYYNMDNVIYGYKYIDNGGNRGGYDENNPTMEITTRIGCSVNCRYCPQSSLITRYCADKSVEKQMSVETFEKCLEKLPLDCNVLFCGMAEPLLNPDCIEMIKIAIDSGRKCKM